MSTAPPQITIIFVAGAWHTEHHISPILPFLTQKYNYKVVPVSLKTSFKSNPPPTIYDNITHVAGVIERELDESENRIAVLGHSVSGQTCAAAISRVLERKAAREKVQGRIMRLFFTACFLDPVRSLDGADWYTIDPATFWVTVTPEMAYKVFYNGMERDKATGYVEALRENMAQMPPEEGYGEGWRSIPGTYFVCGKDNAVRPEMQRLEARECGMEVVELDMDHCPFVSKPEKFAEVVSGVLEGS